MTTEGAASPDPAADTRPTEAPRAGFGKVSPIPHEARPYQGRRAGIVSRALANAVDAIVVAGAVAVLYLAVAAVLFLVRPRSFRFPTPSFALLLGLAAALTVGYFALNWSATGRSYGDHVFGLRVVDFRGERVAPAIALLRAAFCVVFPLGLLWVVVSGENRSVQDLVLRTSVIYDWDVRPRSARRGD